MKMSRDYQTLVDLFIQYDCKDGMRSWGLCCYSPENYYILITDMNTRDAKIMKELTDLIEIVTTKYRLIIIPVIDTENECFNNVRISDIDL